MPHRMNHPHAFDITSLTGFIVFAVSLINFQGLFGAAEVFLKVAVLAATGGYTLWKWRKDYREDQFKNK